MNSIVAQTTAVGVIALVTMFPSPDRLKDAVSFLGDRVEASGPSSTTVLVKAAAYQGDPLVLNAPFDMDCADTSDSVASLSGCAYQLWNFIHPRSTIGASSVIRSDTAEARKLDPEVEQARRALVEICRLRWAMKTPPPDPRTDTICATFS